MTAPPTILIVEDDGILAAHLHDMLCSLGYQTLQPAATAEQAVTSAIQNRPDLILMDIELAGGVNGIAAADRIHATCDIPLVFLTGYSQDPLLRKAKTTLPYGYLIKPVPERELAATIEMALHRHQLDKALKQAEAELEAVYANSPIAMMLIDQDLRVCKLNATAAMYASRSVPELTGLRPGEVLRCIHHFDGTDGCGTHEDCAGCRLRQTVQDTLRTAQAHHQVEVWMTLRDREQFLEACLLVSTVYLCLSSGPNVLVCAQDITRRKRAENEQRMLAQISQIFRQSECREKTFTALVDTLAELSFPVVALERYDEPAGEMVFLAASGAPVLTPGLRVPVDHTLSGVVARNGEPMLEVAAAGRQEYGSPLLRQLAIQSFLCVPLRGKSRILGTLALADRIPRSDLTVLLPALQRIANYLAQEMEREQVKEELVRSEERYRRIVETANEGIWAMDADFRTTFVNSRMASLLGYLPEEMLGRTVSDFMFPEDLGDHDRRMASRQQGKDDFYERRFRRKDGTECWCLVSATALSDRDGAFAGSFAMFTDITEQRRLEEQYRQAQKMEAIGRLAAGVAHDFNNQLTVIRGYSDLLLINRPQDDPLWVPLNEIRNASQRAYATTSHLLTFSRKQILRPQEVDLNELVGEMQGPVAKLIGEDIQLEVVPACDLPHVFIDRGTMHQALMNLILNARDAMPHGGRLTLRTGLVCTKEGEPPLFPGAAVQSYVMLEVADTGVGMDDQMAERVFDPFFTTKEVGKGTGLGLPMVQGFVRQSQGYIDVRSRLGHGSTFRILLPALALSHEAAIALPPETPAPSGSETLLVVEDEEGVRRMILQTLRQNGYRVLEAPGPIEALEVLARHDGPVDLLISDMVMPGMSGPQIARSATEKRPSLRTLFITGYAGQNIHQSMPNILLKPFGMEDLLRRVRQMLDGPPQPLPAPPPFPQSPLGGSPSAGMHDLWS